MMDYYKGQVRNKTATYAFIELVYLVAGAELKILEDLCSIQEAHVQFPYIVWSTEPGEAKHQQAWPKTNSKQQNR